MDYESMYWDAEAKRIQNAFGIKKECEFVLYKQLNVRRLSDGGIPIMHGASEITVSYRKTNRVFYIGDANGNYATDGSKITISYDGKLIDSAVNQSSSVLLARALFHLELLTPEVEAALQVSSHEMMEWTLEQEQ